MLYYIIKYNSRSVNQGQKVWHTRHDNEALGKEEFYALTAAIVVP